MKRYYAKLLLLGEYTVVKGSQALAIPIRNFSGHWVDGPGGLALQQALSDFVIHIQQLQEKGLISRPIDTADMQKFLELGGYFQSNIPSGYGVGSSGALCAAVYDRFGEPAMPKELADIRADLAALEQFFHGSSSGTDPLVSFLNQPLLIDKASLTPVPPLPLLPPFSIFLLNTQIPRQTAPLVELFLQKCKLKSFETAMEKTLVPATDLAIEAYLQGKWQTVFEQFHQIGAFQDVYFEEMIPQMFVPLWKEALASDFFKLKLCGAGGGGFILGMTNDLPRLKEQLYPMSVILPELE